MAWSLQLVICGDSEQIVILLLACAEHFSQDDVFSRVDRHQLVLRELHWLPVKELIYVLHRFGLDIQLFWWYDTQYSQDLIFCCAPSGHSTLHLSPLCRPQLLIDSRGHLQRIDKLCI